MLVFRLTLAERATHGETEQNSMVPINEESPQVSEPCQAQSIRSFWLSEPFHSKPVENFLFSRWYVSLTVPLAIPVLFDYIFLPRDYPHRLVYALGILQNAYVFTLLGAAFFACICSVMWEGTIRSTFSSALEDGLIADTNGDTGTFFNLSREFVKLMRSRWRFAAASLAVVLAMLPNLVGLASDLQQISQLDSSDLHQALPFYVVDAAMFLIILFFAYLGGLLLWSLIVGALWIAMVSSSDALKLQPGHPDNCLGMAGIGTCCLQNAMPLLIGMVLCLLWSQGNKITWFASHSNANYTTRLQPYCYLFVVIQFIIACFLVYRPVWTLHRKMTSFKKARSAEYCAMVFIQEQASRPALEGNDPTLLKSETDRLKLVQSFDPVSLRLSEWPFDQRSLLTYGITPVISLVTTVSKVIHPQ